MLHHPRHPILRHSRLSPARLAVAGLGWALCAAACVPTLEAPDDRPPDALDRSESREVTLRFLRLDAKDFVQTLTKQDLLDNFPTKVLRETWLLDMPLEPLITNALTTLINTPAEEAYTLPASSQNMWKLLNMTPANTVLEGTSLAPLLGVGKAVGLAPSRILADLVDLDRNANIITVELTTGAVIDHVISTHPGAQWRRGPVTPEHPDGRYPVTPASMPVSLYDVVTDFAELPINFGPAAPDPNNPGQPQHPGFIASASPIVAAKNDFEMTVKVDLNALPYKGVDLTNAAVASVNSTASQIDRAFNFDSPDWLQISGLVDALVIDEMTMAIYENPAFIPGGTAKDPPERGDSKVWDLPPWQFERLIAEVARLKSAEIPDQCTIYSPQGDVPMPLEAVRVCTGDNGDASDGDEPPHWTTIAVDPSVKLDSPPPTPAYFWDILLEVAQVRLHDGGLAEGAADIAFTLRDIPVGVTTVELEQQIRDNIQANPAALASLAELLNENTDGAADFYYYVPGPDVPAAQRGDWLFFINPDDIANNSSGDPVRPYSYARPGFFSDQARTQKVSSTAQLEDDNSHEKVMVKPGDILFIEDNDGQVYELEVHDKPGRHELNLTVTRVE